MALSLEQELEQVIAGSDYRLRIWNAGYLHVTVYYVGGPRGAQIGHKLFGGRRRWKRARKFVQACIEGHRELLACGVKQT